jgi:ketosteroid isomerase-like protein
MMAATALTVALAACSAPAQREFGKADRDNITKLVQDFTTAYNAKDPAKITTFFTGGAGLMPPNASTVRGAESIKGYFVSRFGQGATDLAIEPTDIAGSGTLAYIAGTYSLRLAPAGGPERKDRGKLRWVLRQFGGRWLLEYLIFSSDFPPVPTPTN